MQSGQSTASRYGIALLMLAIAFAARLLLDPLVGSYIPYGTFLLAGLISAWYCGFWPTVLFSAIGVFLANYWFMAPRHELNPFQRDRFPMSLGFLVLTIAIATFIKLNRRTSAELTASLESQKTAKEALQENEERLRLAQIAANVGTWEWDPATNQTTWSKESFSLFGLNPVDPEYFDKWLSAIHEEDRETVRNIAERAMQKGVVEAEYRYFHPEHSERYIYDHAVTMPRPDGSCVVFGTSVDVTERKRAELALREVADQFRSTFEQAAVGMAQVGIDGRFLRVNRKLRETLGYSEKELLSLTFQEVTHPDTLQQDMQHQRLLLRGEESSYQTEKRYRRKDGSFVWINMATSLLRGADGLPKYFITSVEDISARKFAEQELEQSHQQLEQRVQERTAELEHKTKVILEQTGLLDQANQSLQNLTAQLLTSQDEERRRVARDLHDTTGQTVAALSMNLGLLSRAAQRFSPDLQEILNQNVELVQQISRELRTMSYLLHPPLLDEAGLPAALSWYVDGFSQRSNVRVDLELPTSIGRLPREMEITLFRVVQECLTNVHRHAASPTATVRFQKLPDALLLEIRDEGKGMPHDQLAEEARSKNLGVGIRGMTERVRQLGGTLTIHSNGKGTVVQTKLPLAS